MPLIKDPHFRIEPLPGCSTPNPARAAWYAMKQDYSEGAAIDLNPPENEEIAAKVVIKHCLEKGHFGVVEHPQLVFNYIGFPHAVTQQIRTHRVGVSFDIQSTRYTGNRIIGFVQRWKDRDQEDPNFFKDLESLFYLRPVGFYSDRQGNKYEYSQADRKIDLWYLWEDAKRYTAQVFEKGFSPEHGRLNRFGYSLRQNGVLSANLRSVMHLLSLRSTADVELETRCWAEMLLQVAEEWQPEIFQWYRKKYYGKNRLAA